jgi:exodeoxyribonuclease V beta subunit
LHELFEDLDFTETRPEIIGALVAETLRTGGIDADKHAAPVAEMVQRTLAVPLDPARPEFTLSRLPRAARLNELEFYFPLRRTSPAMLRDVFARHGVDGQLGNFPERLGRLQFEPVAGFMKGFIDLVFEHEERFYLVDWKSNWLGARVEDYGPETLRQEMMSRHYVLQYHLYVLALDRYLATRLPQYNYARDFGGVAYLFLRGIDPARPELGVFRDRPAPELMRDLRATLLDWKEAVA